LILLLSAELIKKGYRIISGGTDNHLIVVDMTSKNITGRDAEEVLNKIGISVNRSTIPNDPNPPMKSIVRIFVDSANPKLNGSMYPW